MHTTSESGKKASIASGLYPTSENFSSTTADVFLNAPPPSSYVTLLRRSSQAQQAQAQHPKLANDQNLNHRQQQPKAVENKRKSSTIANGLQNSPRQNQNSRSSCKNSLKSALSTNLRVRARLCASAGDLSSDLNSNNWSPRFRLKSTKNFFESYPRTHSTLVQPASVATSSCWRSRRNKNSTRSASSCDGGVEETDDVYYYRGATKSVELTKSGLLPSMAPPQTTTSNASKEQKTSTKLKSTKSSGASHDQQHRPVSFMSRFFANTSDKQRRQKQQQKAHTEASTAEPSSDNVSVPERRLSTPVPTPVALPPSQNQNDDHQRRGGEQQGNEATKAKIQSKPAYSTSSLGRYASKLKQQLSPPVLVYKDVGDDQPRVAADKSETVIAGSVNEMSTSLGHTSTQLSTSLKTLSQLSATKREVKLGAGSENDLRTTPSSIGFVEIERGEVEESDYHRRSFISALGALGSRKGFPVSDDASPRGRGRLEQTNKKPDSLISSSLGFSSNAHQARRFSNKVTTTDTKSGSISKNAPSSSSSSCAGGGGLAAKISRGIIHEFASSSERLMSWKAKLKKTKFDVGQSGDEAGDDDDDDDNNEDENVAESEHSEIICEQKNIAELSAKSDPLPRTPKYVYKTNSVDSNYDMAMGAYDDTDLSEQQGIQQQQWAMGQRRPSQTGGRPDGFYVGLTLVNNVALEPEIGANAKPLDGGGVYFPNNTSEQERTRHPILRKENKGAEGQMMPNQDPDQQLLRQQRRSQQQQLAADSDSSTTSPSLRRHQPRDSVSGTAASGGGPTPPAPRRSLLLAARNSNVVVFGSGTASVSGDSTSTSVATSVATSVRGGGSLQKSNRVASTHSSTNNSSLVDEATKPVATVDDGRAKHYEEIDLATLDWREAPDALLMNTGSHHNISHHHPAYQYSYQNQTSGVYNVQQPLVPPHQGFNQKDDERHQLPPLPPLAYVAGNEEAVLPPPTRITPYSGVPQAKDGEIVRPIAFRPIAPASGMNAIRSHSISNTEVLVVSPMKQYRQASPSVELLSHSNYDNTNVDSSNHNHHNKMHNLSAFTPPAVRRLAHHQLTVTQSASNADSQQSIDANEEDRSSSCSRGRDAHSMTPGRSGLGQQSWHQQQQDSSGQWQIRVAQPPPPQQRPQPISYQDYCLKNQQLDQQQQHRLINQVKPNSTSNANANNNQIQNEYDMIPDTGPPPPSRSSFPITPTGNRSFDFNAAPQKKLSVPQQPVPPVRTNASFAGGGHHNQQQPQHYSLHQQQQQHQSGTEAGVGGGSQNYGSLGSRNSSGIHVTPSPSDSGVAELELALREKENELVHLRQTMEHNEQAIVRVYQEKEQRWQDKLRDWAMRLEHAVASEQRFLTEVDQLHNERADLHNRVQTLSAEKQGLQRKCKELESEMFAVKARLDERRQTNWIVCKQCGCVLTFESRPNANSGTSPSDEMTSSRDSHHPPDQPYPPAAQSPRVRYRRTPPAPPSLDDDLGVDAMTPTDTILRSEVDSLKMEVSGLRQSLHDQVSVFNGERRRWELEKQRVLQYQKLLEDAYQINCMQQQQLQQQDQRLSAHSTPTGTLKSANKDFNVNPYAYSSLQHAPSPYHNNASSGGGNNMNLVHSEPELEV